MLEASERCARWRLTSAAMWSAESSRKAGRMDRPGAPLSQCREIALPHSTAALRTDGMTSASLSTLGERDGGVAGLVGARLAMAVRRAARSLIVASPAGRIITPTRGGAR